MQFKVTLQLSRVKSYLHQVHIIVQTIYLDSYGLPPLKDHVLPFIQNNSFGWIENTQMLQDVASKVCGLYCIYVLYELNRGSSLQNILSNFSKDNLIKNDNDVLLWFSRKKYYKSKKEKNKILKKR